MSVAVSWTPGSELSNSILEKKHSPQLALQGATDQIILLEDHEISLLKMGMVWEEANSRRRGSY